jgi:hypothetical protein
LSPDFPNGSERDRQSFLDDLWKFYKQFNLWALDGVKLLNA